MRDDRLLDVIDQLYDAATEPTRLKAIGALLADQVRASSSLLVMAEKPSGQLSHVVSASRNFDAEAQSAHRTYYCRHDEPGLRAMRRAPPLVAGGEELIDQRDCERSEFYRDFCKRVGTHHLLVATVPIANKMVAGIAIHRDRADDPFSDTDKHFLAAVAPHVTRALQIADKLGAFTRNGGLTLNLLHGLGVGMLLLDGECRPVFANAVAEKLVRSARWLIQSHGRIKAVHPANASEFARMVRAACCARAGTDGTCADVLRLRDPLDTGLPVLIAPFRADGLDLAPAQPLAAVMLSDPDSTRQYCAEAIARAFGLTSAEGRLAAALAAGQTMAGFARRTSLSINTAKAQLRSIFLKTGVSQQTALVGLILSDPVLRLQSYWLAAF